MLGFTLTGLYVREGTLSTDRHIRAATESLPTPAASASTASTQALHSSTANLHSPEAPAGRVTRAFIHGTVCAIDGRGG